ncbi:MAG: DEAD/DEAH box helicase [Xanthomonadaceae bacterium]|jgi:ATP-dependent RNA helicase DeaD|nr:DEAD/DEAH box helicase [Xanthomonadaceae bacterium]
MSVPTPPASFSDFALPAPLLQALADIGYESPSPIQAATIPPLLEGRDVLGQAQTGTGKTAAFALPALARLDPAGRKPQVLVLTPTRELAIQVAEAFQKYATHLPGFHILPIYGGQGYGQQFSALKRGVQVVVGTPGRVIDHLGRGSLDLSQLRTLVLDEADEMLRMGFIDDVEAVLRKTPETRQVALFSATMPGQIRRIAQTYLKDPVEVAIKSQTTTAANIRQRVWMVSGTNKLDALTRILEAEPFDAMIIFARTKLGTQELADRLCARGFAAAAINGDLDQKQREKTIQQLKDGRIDILVATDVAARGLDVERISHVLNYDIPYDTESYVHRIGRTGRAGRSGEAILFAAPRERGMLGAIERATRQKIEPMQLPSVETVNERRVGKFMDRITGALGSPDMALYRDLVERYEREHNVPAAEIAAALARVVQGDAPLLIAAPSPRGDRDDGRGPRGRTQRVGREDGMRPAPAPRARARNDAEAVFEDDGRPPRTPRERPARGARTDGDPGFPMETFRIEVGHVHGVQPGNIVGAIANEAELESRYIGRVDIREDHSLVDLPEGMPREVLEHLKKVWVSGRQLRMRRADAAPPGPRTGRPGKPAAPHRARPRRPG